MWKNWRVTVGLDVNYDEFKNLCGEAWKDDYNYLDFDRSKKKSEGKCCLRNEKNPET